MTKTYKWLIGLIIILSSVVTIGFYLHIFNGELSNQSQDWSSFGSYVSGVLTPILTALNIWVFIKLTQAIADASTERERKTDEEQEKRHKQELDHQKKLLITQFRQAEITQLSNSLNKLNEGATLLEIRLNVINSSIIVDAFANQKQKLFPLLHNREAYKGLIELHKSLSELNRKITAQEEIKSIGAILKVKHKVVSELQKYIIDNI